MLTGDRGAPKSCVVVPGWLGRSRRWDGRMFAPRDRCSEADWLEFFPTRKVVHIRLTRAARPNSKYEGVSLRTIAFIKETSHDTDNSARRAAWPGGHRREPIACTRRSDLLGRYSCQDHDARKRRHPHRDADLPQRGTRRSDGQDDIRQPRLHAGRAGLPHRHLRHLRPRSLQRVRQCGHQGQPGHRPDRGPDGRALALPHAQHHHRLRLRLPRPHRGSDGPDRALGRPRPCGRRELPLVERRGPDGAGRRQGRKLPLRAAGLFGRAIPPKATSSSAPRRTRSSSSSAPLCGTATSRLRSMA